MNKKRRVELEYRSKLRNNKRESRFGFRRRMLLLLGLGTALILTLLYGQQVSELASSCMNRWQMLRAQSECLAYTPHGSIVFSAQRSLLPPDKIQHNLGEWDYYRDLKLVQVPVPECINELERRAPGVAFGEFYEEPVIMALHKRGTPDGRDWLVILCMTPMHNGRILAKVRRPATWQNAPFDSFCLVDDRSIHGPLADAYRKMILVTWSSLEIRAAQMDPTDNSRFLISCTVDGVHVTLCFKLKLTADPANPVIFRLDLTTTTRIGPWREIEPRGILMPQNYAASQCLARDCDLKASRLDHLGKLLLAFQHPLQSGGHSLCSI
jgi:hypothetical protein